MVFDNVTFFEVNLPNEVFGTDGPAETDVERVDVEAPDDQSGGGSKGKLFLAALLIAGVAVAIRRFRSGSDDDETDLEMAYEEPGVEVERAEP